jgi:hypothetical protein
MRKVPHTGLSSNALLAFHLMADTFGTVSARVGMGSACGGCGPGSTIGYGCNGRSKIFRRCVYRAQRWLGILRLSVMDDQGGFNNSNI